MFAKLKASWTSASKEDKPRADAPRNVRQQRRLSKPHTNWSTSRNPGKDANRDTKGEENNKRAELVRRPQSHVDRMQNTPEAIVLRRMQLYASQQSLREDKEPVTEQFSEERAVQDNPPDRCSGMNFQTDAVSRRTSYDYERLRSFPNGQASFSSSPQQEEPDWGQYSPQFSTPVQTASPDDMYAPIRRRSLLSTPGVATRFVRAESEESEYPSLNSPQDWPYEVVVEETPEEEEEEGEEDEDVSLFEWKVPTFVERAQTPSDLDFPHLGTIALGALHITNGCPSPAPSDHTSIHLRHRSDSLEKPGQIEERPSNAAALASSILKHEVEVILTPPPEESQSAWCDPSKDKGADRSRRRLRDKLSQSSDLRVANHSADGRLLRGLDNIPHVSTESFSQSNAASWANATTLEVTTKATETDDDLFEDDTSSISSMHTTPMSAPKLDVPVEVRPAASRSSTEKSFGKSDSGYSSASSVSSEAEARELKSKTCLQDRHKRPKSAVVIEHSTAPHHPKESLPPIPASQPVLSQRMSLPAIPSVKTLQLNESVNSIATYDSSHSTPSVQNTKSRRLQKRRQLLHSRSVSSIIVQSQEPLAATEIPPVPASVLSNLSDRVRAVPELSRTYNNVHKLEDEEDARSQTPFEVEFRFPSPVEEEEPRDRRFWRADIGGKPKGPRLEHRRSRSFFSKNGKADRASKLPGECDTDTAFAIVQDSEALFSTSRNSHRNTMLHGRPIPAQRHSYAGPNPSPDAYMRAAMRSRSTMTGMDDETAASLARRRSRILSENRQTPEHVQRRSLESIPGRISKTLSAAADVPPMPPLPNFVNRGWESTTSLEVPEISRSRPLSMSVKRYPEQNEHYAGGDTTHRTAAIEGSRTSVWTSIEIPSRQPTSSAQSFSSRMSQAPYTGTRSPLRDDNFSRPRPAQGCQPTHMSGHDLRNRHSFTGYDDVYDPRQPSPAPSQLSAELTPRFGRYSGGLQYGYHHGGGIVGSAGSRSCSGEKAPERKSVQLSEGYGIDLSDVPIIASLQRVY